MSFIVATAHALPRHFSSQESLSQEIREAWLQEGLDVAVLERIQKNVKVQGRHHALPLQEYHALRDFGESNSAWIEVALELGEEVILKLLEKAQVAPAEVSLLMSTTVTGIAVPSIEARLMNRISFRKDIKRVPLFGLGCLAGTAGVARVHDYLKGHPREVAILLSIELCSLTIQRKDISIANIVSTSLFGDGAAAVLMVGAEHPLAKQQNAPQVLDSVSVFFPDSEEVMGWAVQETGLKIVLGPGVPQYAKEHLPPQIQQFLQQHELSLSQIAHWIVHPGGPKVINALEEGLDLPANTLDLCRESLKKMGNLSSSSVLIILEEVLAMNPQVAEYGVMLSMGPAFSAEAILLQW